MVQYAFIVKVKAFGKSLPQGYIFQVVHTQKSLDNAAVTRAYRAEYARLNPGKTICTELYLSDIEILSKP